jgi:hypothetical protein
MSVNDEQGSFTEAPETAINPDKSEDEKDPPDKIDVLDAL